MKRLALLFLLLFGTPTAALSAFAIFQTASSGVVNMGGGPNMLERSLFSSNTPSLPYSSWYVPGNGSPAISTSDYYLMNGWYWSIPYDLDTMGADGAAVKAREGFRFIWILCGDHPSTTNFTGGSDFYVAYSNDPQILPDPTTIRLIRAQAQTISVVDQNGTTQNSYSIYQTPYLVYNPDPGAFAPFYIYAESNANGFQHELGLLTTTDFLTATLQGPTIPTTAFAGWSSFGRPTRLGVNNWEVYSFGKPDGTASPNPSSYKYTSIDGWVWTSTFSPKADNTGPFITIGGVASNLSIDRPGGSEYLSYWTVNANKQRTSAATHISTAFEDQTTSYPWQTYAQDVQYYEEDGIASIYLTRGFFPAGPEYQLNNGPYLGNAPTYMTVLGSITSTGGNNGLLTTSATPPYPILPGYSILGQANQPVVTLDNGNGTYNIVAPGGVSPSSGPYNVPRNGGLWHQFVDQYFLFTDATAAAGAAPLGVKASCAAGLATVQWNNSLPHQNYRIYKGASAGTQATLVGTISGTSITDTPTANAQTWYKVVTMNVTEQKSRVVDTYCSSNTALVNKHVTRVIHDGGDITKIDFTFLASADSWLTSNNNYRYLNWWTDVRFGVKLDGSGFIAKIYDLGTTYLPRGGDYTPTTSNTWPSTSSNTSYSTTSFRGTTPSWVNNVAQAHGYYGNGRPNNIQRWNEATFLAAYQKPGTGTSTLLGAGQGSAGFWLRQNSGTSGNIEFSMYQSSSTVGTNITATVPFSGATTARVIAGKFDGTNMTAYLDGVAGTPQNASAYANPNMVNESVLRGVYVGTPPGQPAVLTSGGRGQQTNLANRTYNIDNEALFTAAGLAAFNKGIPDAQIQSWGALYN